MLEPEERGTDDIKESRKAVNGANGAARPPALAGPGIERVIRIEHIAGPSRLLTGTALAQGAWFLFTGLWPLVHITSFQRVTGPRTDLWPVRTVGLLLALIGVVLLTARRRRRFGLEIILLAAGSALALAAMDLFCAGLGRISPVYAGDAAIELAFASLWGFGRLRESRAGWLRYSRRIERKTRRWN